MSPCPGPPIREAPGISLPIAAAARPLLQARERRA